MEELSPEVGLDDIEPEEIDEAALEEVAAEVDAEADIEIDEEEPGDASLEDVFQDEVAAETSLPSGVVDEDEEYVRALEVDVDVDDRGESLGTRVAPKRPGEFTCSSCFLVKHPSQLADPKKMICVDCV